MRRKGGKRKFAGRNMHIEFHNVNPKKAKAADCIYLTENRECQNKKSPHYLAKCFAASYCTFKVKENEAVPPRPIVPPVPKKEEPKIKKIKCSLPLKCHMFSESFGQGEYTAFNEEKRIIEVTFDGTTRRFIYPDAIFQKHLIVPKFAFEIVLKDASNAEKG